MVHLTAGPKLTIYYWEARVDRPASCKLLRKVCVWPDWCLRSSVMLSVSIDTTGPSFDHIDFPSRQFETHSHRHRRHRQYTSLCADIKRWCRFLSVDSLALLNIGLQRPMLIIRSLMHTDMNREMRKSKWVGSTVFFLSYLNSNRTERQTDSGQKSI